MPDADQKDAGALPVTIQSLLNEGGRKLRLAGLDTPDLDSRLLLSHISGLPHAQLLSRDQQPLDETLCSKFDELLNRRLNHEPISRILGRREFWTYELKLSPDTLDPRPDTETLIEFVVKFFHDKRQEPLRILDLGSGSGAILCALLAEFPNAKGLGIDISPGACETARQNLSETGLDRRGEIRSGDWADGILQNAEVGHFDIVVSNPPYIPTGELARLAPEVRLFDPHIALDGGADGLDAFRSITAAIGYILATGGLLAFEIGMDQGDAVREIMQCGNLIDAGEMRDIAGHIRVLGGQAAQSERD